VVDRHTIYGKRPLTELVFGLKGKSYGGLANLSGPSGPASRGFEIR
jgi:hypothetical protein